MAGHPFNEHRSHHHERERLAHLTGRHEEPKHYARGGSVYDDEAEDRALIRKEVKGEALKHDGHKAKHRGDKAVRRAKGGRTGHHGKGHSKTNVNVIVAPGGGNKPPMAGLGGPPGMGPPPPMAAPPMPPRPPMVPPAAPPAGMGAPALGGMPPRKVGGRAYKKGGKVHGMKGDMTRHMSGEKIETGKHRHHHGSMEMHGKRARGGKVHKEFGFADMNASHPHSHEDDWGHGKPRAKGGKVEGKKSEADMRGVLLGAYHKPGIGDRTPIQHSGNKSDTQNIGRGPVITKATGGPIYANGAAGKEMGPNVHAGNNGIGRLRKNKLAKAEHWEA